jgi:hypothetical protein
LIAARASTVRVPSGFWTVRVMPCTSWSCPARRRPGAATPRIKPTPSASTRAVRPPALTPCRDRPKRYLLGGGRSRACVRVTQGRLASATTVTRRPRVAARSQLRRSASTAAHPFGIGSMSGSSFERLGLTVRPVAGIVSTSWRARWRSAQTIASWPARGACTRFSARRFMGMFEMWFPSVFWPMRRTSAISKVAALGCARPRRCRLRRPRLCVCWLGVAAFRGACDGPTGPPREDVACSSTAPVGPCSH